MPPPPGQRDFLSDQASCWAGLGGPKDFAEPLGPTFYPFLTFYQHDACCILRKILQKLSDGATITNSILIM
jgi:hypothetical protein